MIFPWMYDFLEQAEIQIFHTSNNQSKKNMYLNWG